MFRFTVYRVSTTIYIGIAALVTVEHFTVGRRLLKGE
jgi:hypothetical protein